MDSIDVARIVTALNQIADELDYISTRDIGHDLRDQFAMAALPAIISKQEEYFATQAATIAYHIADAMLKAREEK
jgi:hypothetical protein